MLQALGKWAGKWWMGLAAALLAVQVALELAMGRPLICTCGVKLWTSDGITGQSSQHVADWYTPSHIIHGMLLYALAWAVARKWPVGARLLLAMVVEIGWEIFENSAFVIERYRSETAAVDYRGDTILNSGFDTIWVMLGFAIALKLPVKWVVVLAVGFELLAAWAVRDNLTLNVLTFIWPIEAVVDWQSGA